MFSQCVNVQLMMLCKKNGKRLTWSSDNSSEHHACHCACSHYAQNAPFASLKLLHRHHNKRNEQSLNNYYHPTSYSLLKSSIFFSYSSTLFGIKIHIEIERRKNKETNSTNCNLVYSLNYHLIYRINKNFF